MAENGKAGLWFYIQLSVPSIKPCRAKIRQRSGESFYLPCMKENLDLFFNLLGNKQKICIWSSAQRAQFDVWPVVINHFLWGMPRIWQPKKDEWKLALICWFVAFVVSEETRERFFYATKNMCPKNFPWGTLRSTELRASFSQTSISDAYRAFLWHTYALWRFIYKASEGSRKS